MDATLGIVIVLLSLPCWAGQLIAWISPTTAVRLQLTEPEESVEPAFHADVRGEAAWDALTLWTMPVAGVLLATSSSAWAYFGLIAGGMYGYFAGRGIFTRRALQARGLRIGEPSVVPTAYAALTVWGLLGVAVIALGIARLMAG